MSDEQIFNFDPTAVQVALGTFEKGRYQFEVGTAKGYSRLKKDKAGNPTEEKVLGIYYPLKCASPDTHAGQRQIYNAMVHTEGSLGFSKQFVMAALGYNPRDIKSEEEFNIKYAGGSWAIDFATGAVGDVWAAPKGHLVSLECDIQIDTNGNPQQKFSNPQAVVA